MIASNGASLGRPSVPSSKWQWTFLYPRRASRSWADSIQHLDSFDCVDLSCQQRQQGCAVSGAGADFEHSIVGRHARFLAHEGDGVRLRDCLLEANGKCPVVVRQFEKIARHEFMPRHPLHRLEHARIADAALLELLNYHVVPSEFEIHRRGNSLRRDVL